MILYTQQWRLACDSTTSTHIRQFKGVHSLGQTECFLFHSTNDIISNSTVAMVIVSLLKTEQNDEQLLLHNVHAHPHKQLLYILQSTKILQSHCTM